MKLLRDLTLALLGIAFGIIGFGLVPQYWGPFFGCEGSKWLTLEPGCSHWPEILRGMVFVLPIAILAPRRWFLPIIAVALLFLLSFLGGFDGVRSGHYLSIETVSGAYSSFLWAYHNFLGGLLVMVVWLILLRKLDAGPNKWLNRTPNRAVGEKPDRSDDGAG